MKTSTAIPEKSILFAPTIDGYGLRLALVFGNEFRGGECPFYQKQCNHCDIGAGEGLQFDYELNKQRLEFFQDYYADILANVVHLVIYNSGSTLNKAEMSPKTLTEILSYVSGLEKCNIVSLDSREMYIHDENIAYLVKNLRKNQEIKLILGLESQEDEIRIKNLKKLINKNSVEKAFASIEQYCGQVGFEFNILFQPPEIRGAEAIAEATKTVEYGLDLSERYEVPIDFNFHPYYPSRKSREMFPNHPRAQQKDALKALVSMKTLINAKNSNAHIFIGWFDEEHDQEQDKRQKELEKYLEVFNKFNIYQDIKFLSLSAVDM